MKKGKFYTIPYDARCTSEMRYVRMKAGGIAAFGRWMALLGILYEQDGGIDLSNEVMHKVVEAELELKGEQLDEFIETLTEINWIEPAMWKDSRHVISRSVCEQLQFRDRQSTNAKAVKD